MFNSKYKKESLNRLEETVKTYQTSNDKLIDDAGKLTNQRKSLQKEVLSAQEYFNSIANTPKKFDTEFEEIRVSLQHYEDLVDIAKRETVKAEKIIGGGVAGGVAAGVGVATLAPTAAMGIAMTFGTASTGTAIATLSGAAATNAALAWIGGGALAAGGGGVALGETFLALAGPVGWAIGGATIVGGGLLANGKNKKAAEKANHQAAEVEAQVADIKALDTEVKEMITESIDNRLNLSKRLSMTMGYPANYQEMSEHQQESLGILVNSTKAAAQSLSRVVGDKQK